jgi:hypothetical protein
MRMTKAKVFIVGGFETNTGKPEVISSKTGNLNTGQIKRFNREDEAIAFAKRKALSFGEGATLTIDVRSGSRAYVVSGGKLVSPDKARKPAAKKTTAKPKTKTTQTKKPAGKIGSSFEKTMSNIMKDPW